MRSLLFEYATQDKDINGAVTSIKGRYPEEGWMHNEVCKEMIYIIKGSGALVTKNKRTKFEAGDIIIINPKEEYYWKGEMQHFVASIPPWYPQQHKRKQSP